EAAIDFSDDGVGETEFTAARTAASEIAEEIQRHTDDAGRGEVLREGLRLAIIGAPNAGKSSLVNALARRDVAIVSDIPGTTRDIIEVKLDLGGYAVVLADTAGLRESVESIEQEGVRRAKARAKAADFRLVVHDASHDGPSAIEGDLVVRSKSDLVPKRNPGEFYVSART